MKPSTKKGLIVIFSLAVFGGVIAFIHYRRKNKSAINSKNDLSNTSNAGITSPISTRSNGNNPGKSSPKTVLSTPISNPSSTVSSQPIKSFNHAVYSTGDNVNIRETPSMSGKIIGQVNKGQKAGVSAGAQVGDWVPIYTTLKQGVIVYINKQYARIE